MMDGSADQELLDMIASRLMDEYQPSSTPTATRIREHLPMYNVRPRMAKEEPTQVEACACAGEPCTICHDEFVEGNRVAELPCSHVSFCTNEHLGLDLFFSPTLVFC